MCVNDALCSQHANTRIKTQDAGFTQSSSSIRTTPLSPPLKSADATARSNSTPRCYVRMNHPTLPAITRRTHRDDQHSAGGTNTNTARRVEIGITKSSGYINTLAGCGCVSSLAPIVISCQSSFSCVECVHVQKSTQHDADYLTQFAVTVTRYARLVRMC